ncbi:MAG: hypothetical protein SF052_10080 [Bacteroidia bacterium]|nr:hypothetical protein [Bacteroidia bacterium]
MMSLFAACSPKILRLQDTIPTVGFRGIDIQNVQTGQQLTDIKLNLGLRFLFRNPFNKNLLIPEHQVTLKLNGKKIPGQISNHTTFTVPAKGQKLETYTFTLDLNPQGVFKTWNVLGKDNYFEFESVIKLDLSDFTDELANYGVALPQNQITEALNLEEVLKEKLGEHTLEFAFGDTIRLPTLPSVGLSSRPAKVKFLGEMDTLNLGIYQDAITPFVDQILTAELENDLIYPFISQLKNLDCPNLPQPRPCIDMFSDAVVSFINVSFTNADKRAEMHGYWNNMKSDLLSPPEEGDPIFDEIVSTLIPNSQANLTLLQTQWAAFKNADPLVVFPGTGVTGLKVEIPFRFINNNEFAIEAPRFLSEAQLLAGNATYSPVSFEIKPDNNNPTVGAGQNKEMTVIMTLSWAQGAEGVLGLISGQNISPNLKGKTAVDMGYGPLRMEFNLSNMPMQMGGN